ncbi:type IV pilus assembly protein FimV [Rhodocyclaceae bacterium SMB388]
MKRFEPKVLAMLLAGFSLALTVGDASAARLGDLTTLSATGQALRVEIASPESTADRVAACIRVAAPATSTDGIPFVRAATVSLTGRGSGARIVVTHPEAVFEPILKLVLQDMCEARMTKEYTLLLPGPVELATPVAVASPQPRPASPRPARAPAPAAPRATQTWTTVAGESVASIAQAMYPRDAGARNAFIAGVRQANPGLTGDTPTAPLPPGTALNIPSLARVAAASTEPRARATPRPAAARPTTAAPQPREASAPPAPSVPPTAASVAEPPAPVSPADRLVLQQDADRETRSSDEALSQATADELLAREDVLVSAIDRTINSQLEMLERLRRLEEIQTALRDQLQMAEAPLAQLATSAPGTPSASMPNDVPEDRIPERETSPAAQQWPEWWKPAAGALAVALLLLLLLRRRESDSAPLSGATARRVAPTTEWLSEVPTRAGQYTGRETPAQAETPPSVHNAALEWEADARRAGIVTDEATAVPALSQEDEVVEEHESAVELADIMVSFGRLRGAADTLAEFIRANPKQALSPWLKLMDIYRAAGMKPEFDTLARQLNMTFNVKAVTWENFEASRKDDGGLEAMPHILDKVLQFWGSRECQAYLETIVRDNRGGTRQGFGLSVIDDIVVLASILEEHLGRYRPTSP